jgi:4-diphosphocytidyl-2-C-methyl-D-erythritol kinase
VLTLKAPAKINLLLEVLEKRNDGYHEIRSILQTVDLFDELSFEQSNGIVLSCTARELETEENLVLKAARAMRQVSGQKDGARIRLDKQIPWQAGLGGGSSDAATTLLGLNRLWSLGMGTDELAAIGAGIGSDVPFFIYGGACEVQGRGEKVTCLPDSLKTWFVLLKPAMLDKPGKTGKLYGLLTAQQYTDGKRCSTARDILLKGGELDPSLLYNVFDAVAFEAYRGLEQYWRIFEKAGARHIHLAGSGPMLFTMSYDEGEARSVHDKLTGDSIQSYFVTGLGRWEIGN